MGALGLLCEAPTHGWAIAEALGPAGDIGRVYSCTRPLVYKALRQLQSDGLAEVRGTTTSDAGPARTILGPLDEVARGLTAGAALLRRMCGIFDRSSC